MDLLLISFLHLLLGLLAIWCYHKMLQASFPFIKNAWLATTLKEFCALLVVAFLGILAELLMFDYGFFGVAIIFLFYVFKNHKILMIISFIISCILKYSILILSNGYHYFYLLLCLFTISSVFIIAFYNGKQGKKATYFFYLFYPVHLLILYFIFGILFPVKF